MKSEKYFQWLHNLWIWNTFTMGTWSAGPPLFLKFYTVEAYFGGIIVKFVFSRVYLLLMFSFSDLHNLFFFFFLPLHFSHKPFWFWHSPALGTCAHKSHKLVVRDSCKCVHLHSFVLTTHSSFLCRSLCSYSQCDQNRDEFVFYFTLIFTTYSVSSTPHLSALFYCYVNSVRIVNISCQNLSF